MKKVFQVLVAAIVIFAIGALVFSLTIDGMVKSSLESTASEMLQTTVEVDDVTISILDGSGSIDGITIHNPEGFSDRPAVRLKQISLKTNIYSLLSDTVVVKSIEIKQPELFFEQKLNGNNLKVLIQNSEEASSSETYLVVDYLLVQEGSIMLSTDIGGEKSAQATFERFELNDIGRKGSNTTEQTLAQILEPILQKAVRNAAKQGLLEKFKDKAGELLDG